METLFIGANLIFLPETESTNSYAIELLKNVKLPEGSVIHTANQTSGRGQRGNVWNTLPGSNLTVSIVLHPAFVEIKNQFHLYMISALACHDVMTEILNNGQFDIKIKWPNDLLVNSKKIAGILIENSIQKDRIAWSVVGIGINVKQCEFDQKMNATSLQLLTMKEQDITKTLRSLCRSLEKYYLMLREGKYEKIKESYLKNFFALNSIMRFGVNGVTENYLVKGVSENGLLWLEDERGADRYFDNKEIQWFIK